MELKRNSLGGGGWHVMRCDRNSNVYADRSYVHFDRSFGLCQAFGELLGRYQSSGQNEGDTPYRQCAVSIKMKSGMRANGCESITLCTWLMTFKAWPFGSPEVPEGPWREALHGTC